MVGEAPAVRNADDYRELVEIPMHLAAAGFHVTVSYSDGMCMVEVEKDLMEGVTLYLNVEASTYPEALSSLAYRVAFGVAELEDAALSQQQARTSGVNGVS